MTKQIKYEDALKELEALVASIEDPQRDLSSIEGDIKKALELIKFCKETIKGKGDELQSLIDGSDEK